MQRPVLRMGDPNLVTASVPVREFGTTELRRLAGDLWDTMDREGGCGLAAPQIGVNLRVICFGFKSKNPLCEGRSIPQTVLVNPVIEPIGEETEEDWEGCLSLPGLRGVVRRAKKIRYRGFDIEGNPIERTVAGMHARVVQHETDHLDGILYVMRVEDWTKFGFRKEIEKDEG